MTAIVRSTWMVVNGRNILTGSMHNEKDKDEAGRDYHGTTVPSGTPPLEKRFRGVGFRGR